MRLEHHHGAYLITTRNGSELIQTDWDHPATAERFGWSLRRVQKRGTRIVNLSRVVRGNRNCDHASTDGTVDCRECGITASDFIQAAGSFLDSIAE